MNRSLRSKAKETVEWLGEVWRRTQGSFRFVAFSTGKDSLALAAMLYEAVEHERPPCLYVKHDLQFPDDGDYLERLRGYGFDIQVLRPFLGHFELTDRGMGFLTRTEPWCIPMLIGTAFLEWLRLRGANSPREGVMFRGISASEWSWKLHAPLEIYHRLDLPTVNPMLGFRAGEIIDLLEKRYGLPLNPLYGNLSRTYCVCCYAPDRRRQAYARRRCPETCARFYGHVEDCLFGSDLIAADHVQARFRTKRQQLAKHGFMHWRRSRSQDSVGAVKRRLAGGALSYTPRDPSWFDAKHLLPVQGRWAHRGSEIRFWNVPERQADAIMKRMMNCLDCGFCTVQCFACRHFDRMTKKLRLV